MHIRHSFPESFTCSSSVCRVVQEAKRSPTQVLNGKTNNTDVAIKAVIVVYIYITFTPWNGVGLHFSTAIRDAIMSVST